MGLTIDLKYWKQTRAEAYAALIKTCGSKTAAFEAISHSPAFEDTSDWDDASWTAQLRSLQSNIFQAQMRARMNPGEGQIHE